MCRDYELTQKERKTKKIGNRKYAIFEREK